MVEGLVKFTRLNFFVPVPQVRDFEELNAFLRQRCEEDRQRRLRGQPGTKAQLLVEDQAAFLPWPMRAARSKSVHGKKQHGLFVSVLAQAMADGLKFGRWSADVQFREMAAEDLPQADVRDRK